MYVRSRRIVRGLTSSSAARDLSVGQLCACNAWSIAIIRLICQWAIGSWRFGWGRRGMSVRSGVPRRSGRCLADGSGVPATRRRMGDGVCVATGRQVAHGVGAVRLRDARFGLVA